MMKYIEDARLGLADASRRGDLTMNRKGAYALMDAIWKIGTTLYTTSNDSEPTRPPELEAFIMETADVLWRAEPGLATWLPHVANRTPVEGHGARGWLRDRSAVEFLRELYKGTEGGDYADGLGTGEFDEEIRFRADQFDIGLPPAGVPRHHWWWWQWGR